MTPAETFDLRPGYRISRVIRGGWQLAGGHGSIDRATAVADLAAFCEAGIVSFDCADIYTGVEELIGEFRTAFAASHGRTALDNVKVHTKFVPDLDILARITKDDGAPSSTNPCAACAWSGSTSCSSTGGTMPCRDVSRPQRG